MHNLLIVDCKSEFKTFYMNRKRANLLAMALEVDSKLGEMFDIKFSDRVGKRIM